MKDKQQTATGVQKGEPVRPTDPDVERTIDPTKTKREQPEKDRETPDTGGMPGPDNPPKQPPMPR